MWFSGLAKFVESFNIFFFNSKVFIGVNRAIPAPVTLSKNIHIYLNLFKKTFFNHFLKITYFVLGYWPLVESFLCWRDAGLRHQRWWCASWGRDARAPQVAPPPCALKCVDTVTAAVGEAAVVPSSADLCNTRGLNLQQKTCTPCSYTMTQKDHRF